MSAFDLVAVKFTADYGSRAEGEQVFYDPASAHNVVTEGAAEYVDPDYSYDPPEEDSAEVLEGSLTEAVLTPADTASESAQKVRARAAAKAEAEAAKAAEAAKNADVTQ